MGKLRQLSPELWPLFDVILFSYIELIFRGGVSCLPAALLFTAIKLAIFRAFTHVNLKRTCSAYEAGWIFFNYG